MIDQWFDNLYEYSSMGHDSHAVPFGFYWAPVSYITDKHYSVSFFDDETSSSGKILLLEECNKDTFHKVDHPPNKEYNLSSNELLYVSRCKLRLVLSLPGIVKSLEPFHDKRLESNITTVVPIFSFYSDNDDKPKYDPEIIKRINACLYPQFLPLPIKGPFPFVDSFCRIDSVTTVKKEYIKPVRITNKGCVFLSKECHNFFIQWINWFFGYKVEKEFDEIVKLLRSEIGY